MTPRWFRREIYPGDVGSDVNIARRLLHLPPGTWDAEAAHRLRARNRAAGWILTAELAETLGETATRGTRPPWWHRSLSRGMYGDDVFALRERLGLSSGDYDQELEDAVRRWQSANDLTPTGVVDEDLAIKLGE